jgi:hypothetical protein
MLISFTTTSGEERDEHWPSVDAFRNWALGCGLRGIYRVYEEDEDGDWIPVLSGSLTRGATDG